ncbi:MAG: hypothetical protein R2766_07445 [Saprospiraceae bacterium]
MNTKKNSSKRGEKLDLVPSLNSNPEWIKMVARNGEMKIFIFSFSEFPRQENKIGTLDANKSYILMKSPLFIIIGMIAFVLNSYAQKGGL